MTKFDFNFKLKVVKAYLKGTGSTTLCRRFSIKKRDSVLMWVARYRKYGIDGLKVRQPKYDYDGNFKLKVLNWKKQNQASYSQAALHFDISNQGTIANWQKKFSVGGVQALFTRRGRAKHMTTIYNKQTNKTELEKLRAENHALHVENDYLKKVAALVQKRGHRKKNTKSSKN